ncbi:MAG: hypothetical protein A2931_03605 [Candidatus Niyogibacteria bacterium RIFCSPLOWO2_01_FULL_45_48]|uniref:EamA domain-containing protein n=2 Tax=Candidatus Niyogiibacteriota TaxID=1817912 RepID=A0A1G2EY39_9BACT|nr:MAG: hypothetical protein A2835_01425 [Candidatus Niyogibacteria bacterium RIFCSPHIGHO2_01_FULL_45_28]OGZ30168.1 MAG: hypothetical protein A3J00_00680 [Candidatus Niyogibacteria bacterium RIFCSPLOWO2_02_FULL_45_13]OGZ30914.1 MAG: hypothetical protein A2931_03605 [Candidatus Niyogibacteria bacterium RIFCSPLOWO2_01_FULL_45_48]
MSRYTLALLLSLYVCFSWGTLAPLSVKMNQVMGPDKFHPAMPFIWATMGNIFFVALVMLFTGFAPAKSWSWHWSGWAIAWFWSSGGLVVVIAYYLSPGKESVTNAIAATYPALVSAIILWYFLGETMTVQKVFGLIITVIGVITVILA